MSRRTSRRTWGREETVAPVVEQVEVVSTGLDLELRQLTSAARRWQELLEASLWDVQETLRSGEHLDGDDAGDVVHAEDDRVWGRHFRHQEWPDWLANRRFQAVVDTSLVDLDEECWCGILEIDEDALVWLPDEVEESETPEGHLPAGDVRHGVAATFLDGLCCCRVCEIAAEVVDETVLRNRSVRRNWLKHWESGVADWGDE